MKYHNIVSLTVLALLFSGSSWAATTASVNVSCTILPLFEMEVSGPVGGNIEFGAIQKNANQNVQVEAPEVVISAKSNLGQPYMITHKLITPLSNVDGASLPDGSMRVNARSSSGGAAATGQPVGTDTKVLYQSDAVGHSDIVTARYNLDVAPEQEAGDYQSKLLYTIVTV